MSFWDGKVEGGLDEMFDYNRDGRLDAFERAVQFEFFEKMNEEVDRKTYEDDDDDDLDDDRDDWDDDLDDDRDDWDDDLDDDLDDDRDDWGDDLDDNWDDE